MRTTDEIDITRCSLVAAAIAILIGIVFFLHQNVVIADAETSSTNTQVTVSYYTGRPSSNVSYATAYASGDPAVGKVTYTTKSLGRMQLGDSGNVGGHQVYYDAADIHMLAASLNQAESNYQELYSKYIEAYNAVMQ